MRSTNRIWLLNKFAELMRRHETALKQPQQLETMQAIERDFDNIRLAVGLPALIDNCPHPYTSTDCHQHKVLAAIADPEMLLGNCECPGVVVDMDWDAQLCLERLADPYIVPAQDVRLVTDSGRAVDHSSHTHAQPTDLGPVDLRRTDLLPHGLCDNLKHR
jgi:hypothetical protein